MPHVKSNSDVFIRSAYSPRCRVSLDLFEPTITKQSFSQDCDINIIMQRFEKTGIIDSINNRSPQYGDFSDITDYQGSLNQVMRAQEGFSALPASLRSRFDNDPALLLEFLQDSNNYDEAVKLGLIDQKLDIESQKNIVAEGDGEGVSLPSHQLPT